MLNLMLHTGSVSQIYGTSAQGTGPIVLSSVECIGEEMRLLECPNTALDTGTCGHHEDSGVTCLPGMSDAICIH